MIFIVFLETILFVSILPLEGPIGATRTLKISNMINFNSFLTTRPILDLNIPEVLLKHKTFSEEVIPPLLKIS